MILHLKVRESRSPPGLPNQTNSSTNTKCPSPDKSRCRITPGNAGWSSPVARQAHNLKVISSNLIPATTTSIKSNTLQAASDTNPQAALMRQARQKTQGTQTPPTLPPSDELKPAVHRYRQTRHQGRELAALICHANSLRLTSGDEPALSSQIGQPSQIGRLFQICPLGHHQRESVRHRVPPQAECPVSTPLSDRF